MKPKRTKSQRALDIVLIEEWNLKGWTQTKMAEELSKLRPYSVTQQTIAYDLKTLTEQWKQQSIGSREEKAQREIKGIELQEREVWMAWEKSKQDAVRKAVEITNGTGAGAKEKKSATTEGQCGDPAFQRLLIELRTQKAKLLGLDAPTRQEISGPAGAPVEIKSKVDYDRLTTEELLALEQLMIKAEGNGE